MAESNITVNVGYKVDESSLAKVFIPGDNTFTQIINYKTTGLDKVVILGDHKATQTLDLNASQYMRKISKVPSFPQNMTVSISAINQTSQGVRQAVSELSKIPGGGAIGIDVNIAGLSAGVQAALRHIDRIPGFLECRGEFRGANLLQGLMQFIAKGKSAEEVIRYLQKSMEGGSSAVKTFGSSFMNAIKGEEKLDQYIRHAIQQMKMLKRYTTSIGLDYKDDKNYKAFARFLKDAFSVRGTGNIDAMRKVMEKYEKTAFAFARSEKKTFKLSQGDLMDVKKLKEYNDALATLNKMLVKIDNTMSNMRSRSKGVFDISSLTSYGKIQSIRNEIQNAIASGNYGAITGTFKTMKTDFGFANAFDTFKTEFTNKVRDIANGSNTTSSASIASALGISEKEYRSQVERLNGMQKTLRQTVEAIMQKPGNQTAYTKMFRDTADYESVRTQFARISEECKRLGVNAIYTNKEINNLETALERIKYIGTLGRRNTGTLAKAGYVEEEIKKMTKPLNDYKRQLQSIVKSGNMNALDDFLTRGGWGKARRQYEELKRSFGERSSASSMVTIARQAREAGKAMQEVVAMKKEGKNVSMFDADLKKIRELIAMMRNATTKEKQGLAGVALKNTVDRVKELARQLKKNRNELMKSVTTSKGLIGKAMENKVGNLPEMIQRLKSLREAIKNAANEQERLNAVTRFNNYAKYAGKQIDSIVSRRDILSDAHKMANKMFYADFAKYKQTGADTSMFDGDIRKIQELIGLIRHAKTEKEALDAKGKLSAYLNGVNGPKVKIAAQYRQAQDAAVAYNRRLQEMGNLHSQNTSLVSQLGQEIAMAYSVSQIRQFLANVIEIGGQFEYQRKSISTILNDAGKANMLFNQVKRLALRSPFSTLQLDQYVKELSAFSVPYEELFDKMQKLADISAGTGTDMSRIILAYGHVRAAGYLEGMQRRQFTNANIPIISQLQKYYRDTRGENFTSKDIYNMISEKQVTSKDVDAVLMSMAEPGGMFYNMQEEMANTTKGVWKNVSDAVNHMYMDLENSHSGVLKNIGEGLKSLLATIKNIASGIEISLGTWLLYKACTATILAGSKAILGTETMNTVLQAKKLSLRNRYLVGLGVETKQMMLQNNSFNSANKGFLQRFGLFQKLDTYSAQQLINNKQISKEDVKRLIAMKQITAEQALQLRNGKGKLLLTKQEVASIKQVGMMSRMWAGFASTIGSAFMSMLPMMLISGVIVGISTLISKAKEAKKKIEEMNMALGETARNMKEKSKPFMSMDFNGMTNRSAVNNINEMIRIFRDNVANADVELNRMFGVRKTDFLDNEIEKAKTLQRELGVAADTYEEAFMKGDGGVVASYIGDNKGYKNKAEDYVEIRKEFTDFLNKALVDPRSTAELKKFVDVLSESSPVYAKATKNLSTVAGKIKAIYTTQGINQNTINSLIRAFSNTFDQRSINAISSASAMRYRLSDYQTASAEMIKGTANAFRELGYTSEQITLLQKKQVEEYLRTNEATQNYYKELMALSFATGNLASIFNQLEGRKWNDDVGTKDLLNSIKTDASRKTLANPITITADSYGGAIKELQDRYASNKTAIKNIDNAKGKARETDKQDKAKMESQNKLIEQLAKDYGFELEKTGRDKNGSGKSASDKELQKWKKEMAAVDELQNIFDRYHDLYKDNAENMLKTSEAWKKAIEVMPKDFNVGRAYERNYYNEYRRERIKQGIKGGKNVDKEGRNEALVKETRKVEEDVLKAEKERYQTALGMVEKAAETQQKNIELYKSILEKTGDELLAANVAFDGKGIDAAFQNLNDGVQTAIDMLNAKLMDAAKKANIPVYTYETLKALYDEDPTGMSIENLGYDGMLKKIFEQGMKTIEAAVLAEKQTLIGILNELQSEREKLATEGKTLEIRKKMLKKAGRPQEEIDRLQQQYDSKVFRNSANYMRFGTNMMSMTPDAMKAVSDSIISDLSSKLKYGDINPVKYIDELKSVFDKITAYNSGTGVFGTNGKFGTFLNGGLEALNTVKADKAYGKAVESADKVYRLSEAKAGIERRMSSMDPTSMKYMQAQQELSDVSNELANAEKDLSNATVYLKEKFDNLKMPELKNAKTGLDAALAGGDALAQSFKMISDTFYATGNKKAGRKMEYASDIVGGFTSALQPVSDIFGSIMKGDIAGMVKGAIMAPVSLITGPIKAIAELHDKKLQHKIEDLKESFNSLGADISKLDRQISRGFGTMTDVQGEKLQKKMQQLSNVSQQLSLEMEKKNSDQDAIEQYKEQIDSMKDEIEYFSQELANTLYGIDFKGWASQLSDALWQAFQNGEDYALAWEKTVGDIVRSVSSNILRLFIEKNVMEPLFDKYLKVEVDSSGNVTKRGLLVNNSGNLIDLTKPENKRIFDMLINEISASGNESMQFAEMLYSSVSENNPFSSNEGSAGGLQKIGESLTEKTGSQMAGYLNSMNTHVSVMRSVAQSQLTQMEAIQKNTLNTANAVAELRDDFRSVMEGGSSSVRIR